MADRKVIIVITGEIASGKTTLADKLEDVLGFKRCKTKEGLAHFAKKKLGGRVPDRDFLQKHGEYLDTTEDGKWVLEYFQHLHQQEFHKHDCYVIDSARILRQIQHVREAYSYYVFHIHLEASPESLQNRFNNRGEISDLTADQQRAKYQKYKDDPTEKQVNTMRDDADLIINTDRCNSEDVFIRVASFFKLLPSTHNELVDVIVGGQFGSEGKGQMAAHISPEYRCLMRVGGPNAGHTVFERPYNHVFHLLPSGLHRAPNAKLLIGPGAVLNIEKLLEEIREFAIEVDRLIIDENAIIISPKDVEEEKRVQEKIGSTAQGVGIATATNIAARLYGNDAHKAKNFQKELRPFLGSTAQALEDCYARGEKILLEGTQGTGLSLHHGIYPFVTSRDTTVSGCLSEAGISPRRLRKIIMVARTYPIRVAGNSGPFCSNEINWDIVAERSGNDPAELKQKEKTTTTKRDRRVGEFSWQMFRKACELNSPTDIALSFTDHISANNKTARRFENLDPETRKLIDEIERCAGVPVSLIGTTFDYRAVIDRRNWK